MIVLHIAPLSGNPHSGLTYSVPRLVEAQNAVDNVKAGLVISKKTKIKVTYGNFPVFYLSNLEGYFILSSLPRPFNKPDIGVIHSTYIPLHAFFAWQFVKNNIPYILVPRGGLTVDAQAIKKYKKMFGNILFLNKMIKKARAIHYLTKKEHEKSINLNTNTRYLIFNNGIDVGNCNNINKLKKRSVKKFTFIGRFNVYHKGLDILLYGLAKLGKETLQNNMVLRLYGPKEKAAIKQMDHIIKSANLQYVVYICDPVYGEKKKNVLYDTDIFVHTSRFEGHPISVLEAFAHGVPCLLTPETGIDEQAFESGAAWKTECKSDNIAQSIYHLLSLSDNDLELCGQIAKIYAKKELSWNVIAKKIIQQYENILNDI